MKLSYAAAYAVHALVRMTSNEKVSPIKWKKLARESGTPERFLLNVLQSLARADILQASRGPNGGFTLTQQPDEISLLDVIEAVEGPIVAVLPTKDKFPDRTGKRLVDVLQGVTDNARRELQAVKISDLVESRATAELKPRKSGRGL